MGEGRGGFHVDRAYRPAEIIKTIITAHQPRECSAKRCRRSAASPGVIGGSGRPRADPEIRSACHVQENNRESVLLPENTRRGGRHWE